MRRLIGIEPEVIQCAKANCVCVRILRNGFGVPRYEIGCLSDAPRRTAVALTVKCPVVCPARLLWRRVKADVT